MTINKDLMSVHVAEVSAMTVDEFQTACENYKISAWEIDHMVYDLAKALTLSRSKEDGRNI